MALFKLSLRRLAKDESGAITVEMGVVALAVFFMVPVLMDITTMIGDGMTLSSSLRAGAQVALVQPNNTSAITDAIELSSGFPDGSVTVTTQQFCECSDIPATCGATACPGTSVAPATYMVITAQHELSTVIDYSDPAFSTVSRTTTIRVR